MHTVISAWGLDSPPGVCAGWPKRQSRYAIKDPSPTFPRHLEPSHSRFGPQRPELLLTPQPPKPAGNPF